MYIYDLHYGLPWWLSGKESAHSPWVGKIPWRKAQQSSLEFLPGESHGQRSLEGYSPWGYKESDMTEVTEHAHMLYIIYIHIYIFYIYIYIYAQSKGKILIYKKDHNKVKN